MEKFHRRGIAYIELCDLRDIKEYEKSGSFHSHQICLIKLKKTVFNLRLSTEGRP